METLLNVGKVFALIAYLIGMLWMIVFIFREVIFGPGNENDDL